MIRSYKNKETKDVHDGKRSQRLDILSRKAHRKLDQIHNAAELNDLSVPPGNNLERMQGRAQAGQYSIRINDKWHICFRWNEVTGHAEHVEIVDYHDESRSRHK